MANVEVGERFTISGEAEEEYKVEVLGVVTLEDTDYAAVGFVEDLEEEDAEDIDVFFLKVDSDGDFEAVESDEEFEKVSKAFDGILNDE